MPDPRTLRPGDRIRILRVQDADLRQRESEIARGAELAGWTADTIERIIAQQPIVRIDRVDEDDQVWYDVILIDEGEEAEHHTLIVYDDDTWEPLADAGPEPGSTS